MFSLCTFHFLIYQFYSIVILLTCKCHYLETSTFSRPNSTGLVPGLKPVQDNNNVSQRGHHSWLSRRYVFGAWQRRQRQRQQPRAQHLRCHRHLHAGGPGCYRCGVGRVCCRAVASACRAAAGRDRPHHGGMPRLFRYEKGHALSALRTHLLL